MGKSANRIILTVVAVFILTILYEHRSVYGAEANSSINNFVTPGDIEATEETGYTLIITGYDWRPAVDKMILNLGTEIAPYDISKDTFRVSTTYSGRSGKSTELRTIKAAYTSDKDGKQVAHDSKYATLEINYANLPYEYKRMKKDIGRNE